MPLGRGLSALISSAKTTFSQPQSSSAVNFDLLDRSDANRVWQIPLTLIRPNPHQPRQSFSHADLEDLINSIKEKGIIQPLLVSETADGKYELIAGERRFRAAEILGLATAPALVRQVKESEKLELALIENIQRKDLNPVEEAFAYERLIDEFDLTHEAIAKKIGKSRPYVSNILSILSLPSEIQQGLINNLINYSSARAIVGLENSREQLKMYRQLIQVKKPTREVEDNIAHQRYKTRGITKRDPLIMDYEKSLRELLGTRVKITQKGEKGTILIEYYSLEEFQRIIKTILK